MALSDDTSRWTRWIFSFVLMSLIGSSVYSVIGIVTAPSDVVPGAEHLKIKSDYVLMMIQCLLGIAVMFLPSFLERRIRIVIPGTIYIFFVVFLYAAIYLGEIRSFYYRIPQWDLILHGFSGLMLGALSFSVIDLLNGSERVKFDLSPVFVALFAFCFAVAMGVLWEVYEFGFDGLLDLNMQRYKLQSGKHLIGRSAVENTMNDLIIDAVGAIIMSAIGYMSLKNHRGWINRLIIRRKKAVKSGKPAETGK